MLMNCLKTISLIPKTLLIPLKFKWVKDKQSPFSYGGALMVQIISIFDPLGEAYLCILKDFHF